MFIERFRLRKIPQPLKCFVSRWPIFPGEMILNQKQRLLSEMFGSKPASVACILIAIINKMLIAWLYSDLIEDKSLYLLFSQTLLQSGTLTEPLQVFETGETVQTYNPAALSLFYSVICLPFLAVTNSIFVSQLIASLLGWILFFTSIFRVAQAVFQQRLLANLFVLGTGFFLYPHELDSTPKDTFALAFTLWSIFFAWRFLRDKPSISNSVLLSSALICLAFTKLLYTPLVVLIPAVLLLWLRIRNKHQSIPYILFSFFLVVLGVGCVYAFMISPAQSFPNYYAVIPKEKKLLSGDVFFPDNLIHIYPFVTSSLINSNFWGVQLERLTKLSYGQVMRVLRMIDVVSLLCLAGFCLAKCKKLSLPTILLLLSLSAFTLLSVVVYLSLVNPPTPYRTAPGAWTWVIDARSFILPMLVLQLLLFLFAFRYKKFKVLRIALLLLFSMECVHGLYFTIKQTANAEKILQYKEQDDPVKKITAWVHAEAKGQSIGLVTSDQALRRYAILQDINTYAFTTQPMIKEGRKPGGVYLVATLPQDSILLEKIPAQSLTPLDTIHPFILHRYQVRP